jgi:hypothetical protein
MIFYKRQFEFIYSLWNYIYYEHDSFALCNWKSHLIILALRSIIVIDDETTVRFLCDGLFVLSSVVWSENDSTLTLSNIESGDERSDCDWFCSYS